MSKKLSPFDFVNSICAKHKPDLMENDFTAIKAYTPFIVNRQFSYFPDTVLVANEVNTRSHMPPRAQYDFYRFMIRAGKRFAKWNKKASDDKLEVAVKYYGVSKMSLRSSIDLISTKEINRMKKEMDPGGR